MLLECLNALRIRFKKKYPDAVVHSNYSLDMEPLSGQIVHLYNLKREDRTRAKREAREFLSKTYPEQTFLVFAPTQYFISKTD